MLMCGRPRISDGSTMMSSFDAPAGTIGKTFSKASVRKSTTTGRSSIELALSIAVATSSGDSTRMPDASHRLGPLDVVGEVGREVDLRVALLVEHLLPLADHAEVGVVEDGDLDRDAFGTGRDQLLRGHLEAAVAVDGPDHLVGSADLGPDGRGDGESHGPEPAGVDPRVGVVELPPLGGEHLVLADARGDDGVLWGHVAQRLDDELGLERSVPGLLVVDQRELLLPLPQLGPPGRQTLPGEPRRQRVGRGGRAGHGVRRRTPGAAPGRSEWASPQRVEGEQQLLDHQPAVAGDGHVGVAHLVELGRVDVDMDDLASGAKALILPVTRSSNRLPRAISRSDRCMAVTAV